MPAWLRVAARVLDGRRRHPPGRLGGAGGDAVVPLPDFHLPALLRSTRAAGCDGGGGGEGLGRRRGTRRALVVGTGSPSDRVEPPGGGPVPVPAALLAGASRDLGIEYDRGEWFVTVIPARLFCCYFGGDRRLAKVFPTGSSA